MKLREYLDANKLTPHTFAAKVGLSYPTVFNALNGLEVKFATAIKIEDATLGVVTCRDLVPTKVRAPRPRRLEKRSVAQVAGSYEHQQDNHQKNNEVTPT